MDRITRLIFGLYCAAIALAVLFVPWSGYRGGRRYWTGYSFVFGTKLEQSGWVIEYGMVGLELVAITAIAGICYVLRDRLDAILELASGKIQLLKKGYNRTVCVYEKDCARRIPQDANFCPHCGRPQK